MKTIFVFTAIAWLSFLSPVALAQDQPRAQQELAKLPMYERLLNGEDAKKAVELELSFNEALKAEDWAEAGKYAQELLDLRIACQGADHWWVTEARENVRLATVLAELAPEQARQLLRTYSQLDLVVKLWQAGQFQEALPIARKVLETRKNLLGGNNRWTAEACFKLALIHKALAENTAAEPLYIRALDLYRNLLGENHPNYANSLNSLAMLYHSMGEYAKAEPLYVKALDLRRILIGTNDPDYISSLNNLAGLYSDRGEYAKAEPLYIQALELRRILLGENHRDYANSLNNLGLHFREKGEYAKAEPLCVQALDLYRTLLGENHPDYARGLNNLAGLFKDMGEHAKAEPLYLQALDLRKKLLGENHPLYALSLNNLALLYREKGEYAKAEPLCVRTVDLYRNLMWDNHPDYVRSLINLAALYCSMGEYTKAEHLFLQTLDLNKKLLGENHPSYATCLNNLATLYFDMGDYSKSEPLYSQARNLRKNLLGENHPSYAQSLKNLASMYCGIEEYVKAEPLLVECTRSFEMSRIVRGSGFQRAIGGDDQSPYLFLASISARLNKPQQGFVALERNMGRAFLDLLAERLGQTFTHDQQARQSRISNELSAIEKRISVLVGRANPTKEEKEELSERISARSKLNVELAELTTELSTQRISDLAAIKHAIPVGHGLFAWVDVGSSRRGREEHSVCVLLSSGEPFWVPLPGSGENGTWTKEDGQLPAKVREALAQPVPPSNLPELIEQLRRQRIKPVLAHLKEHGITQLYVIGVEQMAGLPVEVIAPEFTISYVPSGTFLARLPEKPKFENTLFAVGDPIYEVEKAKQLELTALPTHGLLVDALAPGGKAEELGLSSGQVLLQYGDTKLTSIDDLKAAVQKATEAGTKTAKVTVWSVDDSNQPGEQVVEFPVGPLGVILSPDPAPAALVSRRKSEAVFASISRGEEWSDLPGTRYEVEQLRKLFPASTALLDDQANEVAVDALRQADDLSKFRYLHFATHGKGNSVTAFESKLVLSQDQPKGEIKAGEPWMNNEISAREVLDYWKLNADLVTLSACQTGLGRQGGGEGLLGFAQAFLLAGSRSVCLSLWEVDDIATALLMQRFYQNLLGQRQGLNAPLPKAKALAEAKHWLRNLTATEATALTAQLTGGIARGTRQVKTFKVPPPSTPAEIAAGDDYKPYARPHYWSAFILIGEPE